MGSRRQQCDKQKRQVWPERDADVGDAQIVESGFWQFFGTLAIIGVNYVVGDYPNGIFPNLANSK